MSFEWLSFVGAAFELTAIYLLGKHNRLGFVSNIAGGVVWITYVVLTQSAWGLLFVCGAAFFLNVKGFRRWEKS